MLFIHHSLMKSEIREKPHPHTQISNTKGSLRGKPQRMTEACLFQKTVKLFGQSISGLAQLCPDSRPLFPSSFPSYGEFSE